MVEDRNFSSLLTLGSLASELDLFAKISFRIRCFGLSSILKLVDIILGLITGIVSADFASYDVLRRERDKGLTFSPSFGFA